MWIVGRKGPRVDHLGAGAINYPDALTGFERCVSAVPSRYCVFGGFMSGHIIRSNLWASR